MTDLDLLAICDVESTGLNPTTDEVIELGCVLYSLSHNTVLQQVSTLVHVTENSAENVNGISAKAANSLENVRHIFPLESAIRELIQNADAVVAHNAVFDKAFISPFLDRFKADKINWIDSRAIQWPRATRQGCNLVELALCYGIPVWSNHRALTDCQLLAHIIQREPEAKRLLEKELEPKVWVIASLVSKSNEDLRSEAKALGFVWEGEGAAPGCFAKQININDVESLPKSIGPTVTTLEDWLWCFVPATREDKDLHALAKEWGFRFNQPEHPMPYKWMRPMPRDTAWWIRESTPLPIQVLDAPYQANVH